MSAEEPLELAEIQGLVLSGYGERPCAKYVIFAIDDVPRARAWLGGLVDRLQYGEFIETAKGGPPFLADVCLNVGFTYAGFARLGLSQPTLLGFAGSFRSGMAAPHRARQLGDDGESAPERWLWGGPHCDEVHGVLLVFAGSDDGEPTEDALCLAASEREVHGDHGLRVLSVRNTLPTQRNNRAEHFGFADGISNPTLAGLVRSHKHDVIPDGEVLLGYRNAYGKYGLSPLVAADDTLGELLPESRSKQGRRDFGRNGSYLVFRELAQDVATFWQFAEQAAAALPEPKDAIWLASRFVGRWPNGAPVTQFPELDDPHRESHENAFGYHHHADFFGAACPIGSHIRRTNPRDTLLPIPHDPPPSEDIADRALAARRESMANRHRLMRRGRSFGARRSEHFDLAALKQPDGVARGLHFLCFVANIRRQFEFVQSTWVINPHFAGLSRDPDPLLGARRSHPFEAQSFTLPGCPARFVDGLPRVVETRGGAYFFMPSRRALCYLAALGDHQPPVTLPALQELERTLERFECEKVARDFARQAEPKRARRAFHSKCHGIVRATLEVDATLPASWQAGVFIAGARYPAWVRFSSGLFGEHSDAGRDLHGMAIKLMGVPDRARASSFEKHTQDFVLVDTPRLMVRDPREVLAFERASERHKLRLALHLLRHPAGLQKLLAVTSVPAHPLERAYNSVTAFAFGESRSVRFVVRLRRGEQLVSVPAGPDRLREGLRAQLATGPVVLELCVQNRGSRAIALEDASLAWKVREERLATLTLHPEGFGTPAQEELGERLAFNPWHGLAEHRPLGAMNAARRLYRSLYELRMRLNGKLPFEPSP